MSNLILHDVNSCLIQPIPDSFCNLKKGNLGNWQVGDVQKKLNRTLDKITELNHWTNKGNEIDSKRYTREEKKIQPSE